MSKRKKFVTVSLILSSVFLLTASLENVNRFLGIGAITVLSVILFYWSLSDTLRRGATYLLLIPPALFTLGVGSFWFLLPSLALARAPIVVLYGIGLYALALTANIYCISTLRNIALLRAAKSVSFVITLFNSFLLFDSIFSFRFPAVATAGLIFFASIFLSFPAIWESVLEDKLDKVVLRHSLSYSIILSSFSLGLYFWPTGVVSNTIFLTVVIYVLLGLSQAQFEGRLFKNVVKEYLFVGTIVIISMVLFTSYRG